MGGRRIHVVSVAAAFACGVLATALATGQPDAGARNQSEIGAQHAELAKLAGEYATASKLIISDGADPSESTGQAKVSAIVDGRFIAIDESGETLGNPFKSQKIWGFNSGAGRYESVWMYTGSTAMTTLAGKAGADPKTIKLDGSFEDADSKTRYAVELSLLDAKSFRIVQTAMNADGSAGVKIETVYTRK